MWLLDSVLVTFLIVVINHSDKSHLQSNRLNLGSQFEGTVLHGGEVKMAGVQRSWSLTQDRRKTKI